MVSVDPSLIVFNMVFMDASLIVPMASVDPSLIVLMVCVDPSLIVLPSQIVLMASVVSVDPS